MRSEKEEKRPRCAYCGNNPVNHSLQYISQSVWVFLNRTVSGVPSTFAHLSSRIEEKGIPFLFCLLRILGLVRFKREIAPLNDRSRVVVEEAVRRGHPIEQAFFCGTPTEEYRVERNGEWHYFMSIPVIPDTGSPLSGMIDSKVHLKDFFIARGIKVPRGGRAGTLGEAHSIFKEVTKPVIVKPEIGSRGRHTVTHITTEAELAHAFRVAQTLCKYVVVEEHLVGSVYRATYVDGKVCGILRGDPPRITGDGTASISELIVRKNATKHERQKDFKTSASSLSFLLRQGYDLDSILPAGVTIDLSEKIGLSYGGFAAEDFPFAHPKLVEALTHAGDTLGIPLIGFDLISEDIRKDPDTVRWGIIEANSLPFIDLHHFPVEGEPINVAASVWDAWENSRI